MKQQSPNQLKFYISFYNLVLLGVLLSCINIGCRCDGDDCAPTGANVELNFLSDGEDVIFGGSPSVQLDDVRIIANVPTGDAVEVLSGEFFGGNPIDVFIEEGTTYTVILGALDTIEIQGTTQRISTDGCCDAFEFISFSADGEEICNALCSEIFIEVE